MIKKWRLSCKCTLTRTDRCDAVNSLIVRYEGIIIQVILMTLCNSPRLYNVWKSHMINTTDRYTGKLLKSNPFKSANFPLSHKSKFRVICSHSRERVKNNSMDRRNSEFQITFSEHTASTSEVTHKTMPNKLIIFKRLMWPWDNLLHMSSITGHLCSMLPDRICRTKMWVNPQGQIYFVKKFTGEHNCTFLQHSLHAYHLNCFNVLWRNCKKVLIFLHM